MQPFGYAEQSYPFGWRANRCEQRDDFVPLKLALQMVEITERSPDYLPTLSPSLGEEDRAFALPRHEAQ